MSGRQPWYERPGTYVRYVGPTRDFPTKKQGSNSTHYLRLLDREAPLKYVWSAAGVSPGVSGRTPIKSFGDMELDPDHIAQVFMGVSLGSRVRFWHPTDTRILKWDLQVADINEQDVGNIEYNDSPIDSPQFEFWIAPTRNFVPAVDMENILGGSSVQPPRSIDVQVFFAAALFNFQFVEQADEPDTYDKLVKFQIPSKPISFGGGVKAHP